MLSSRGVARVARRSVRMKALPARARMLTEAGGDLDKAVDLFRKEGVKASLAERAASEGRVFGAKGSDGRSASLVEINCNTDFTARSEPVQQLGTRAANLLIQNAKANV